MRRIVTDNPNTLGPWLCERVGGQYAQGNGSQFIGMMDGDNVLAVTGYDSWNGRSIHAHIAGEGRKWMSKDYLWYIFHYPFIEVGADKIISPVNSTNMDALCFCYKLGFTHEATIKDASPDGDVYILTMTKDKCRFLRNIEGYPSAMTHNRSEADGFSSRK